MMRRIKKFLLVSLLLIVAAGCIYWISEAYITCGFPSVMLVDKNGDAYGYHDCKGRLIGGHVYFIQYIDGPYQDMVFRLHRGSDRRDHYIVRGGKKFYLHRE